MNNNNNINKKAFVLKGSLFTLSILQLHTCDMEAIRKELQETYSLSPNFFKNAPIILDLQKLPPDEHIDFASIGAELRNLGILPIGIIGGSENQQNSALSVNLGVINNSKSASTLKKRDQDQEPDTQNQSIIINRHVRSGQRVCSQNGDLIIIASVSAGAEILASGNIHVYGTLNGRALAGMNGNKNARIFCSALNAELLSVAGIYQTNEDYRIKSSDPVQICLENDKLVIKAIN